MKAAVGFEVPTESVFDLTRLEVNTRPFPHVIHEQFISPEHYRRLADSFPACPPTARRVEHAPEELYVRTDISVSPVASPDDGREPARGEEVGQAGAPDAETRVLLDEFMGSRSFRLISAYWRFKRRVRSWKPKGS